MSCICDKVLKGLSMLIPNFLNIFVFSYLLYLYICASHIIYAAAPSGPPENFTAVVTGPRTIDLQWGRPLTPNGLITSYTLQYTNVNQSLNGATSRYTAENLNEFTNYSFSLSASTSAGTGPSTAVNATTQEDGEYGGYYMYIQTFIVKTKREKKMNNISSDYSHMIG